MIVITVVDGDGDRITFEGATRFSTDEANNLCVYAGPNADKLIHLFAVGHWREAVTDVSDD